MSGAAAASASSPAESKALIELWRLMFMVPSFSVQLLAHCKSVSGPGVWFRAVLRQMAK
jgi:hypothetical protein